MRKKPHIKRVAHARWRVYYEGWRTFNFHTLRECLGLIHLDKILSNKGYDIEYLVELNYIDLYTMYSIPLWTKEFSESEPEVFVLLQKLERLRKDGILK